MNAAHTGVIVIGSGPSGAMAARELTDRGVPVTLLEAGTSPPAGLIVRAGGHTVARWRSRAAMSDDRHVRADDQVVEWYSSLSPGGLSNYWTAAVPRFAPEDFTDGGRLDERFVWPVGYDDLVPFYEVAEDLLRITGSARSLPVLPAGHVAHPSSVPAPWQALAGHGWADSVTMLPMAIGHPWMIARRGSEFNSYHVVVRPLERCDSFRLVLGATVSRLVLSADGGRVEGVEYVDTASHARVTMRADAVVLAAGTIDTTRLLLSSIPGAEDELSLIGRYLHDHPRVWWWATLGRPMPALPLPMYLARRAYSDSPPLSGSSASIGLAASRDRLRAAAHVPINRVGAQVFGTMIPSDHRGVRLADSGTDRFGLPRVTIDLAYDDRSLATLHDAAERFMQMCADGGNPAVVHHGDWRPRPGNSVHYAGTVRMHADARHGALDEWNRLRGVANLVVTDMACFTTNPEKNPTLTAMALAARAARRLATDL